MLASEHPQPRKTARRARGPKDSLPAPAVALDRIERMVETARKVPERMREELDQRPVVVLAALAGTSFVAGAIVGTRLGRAALVALLPVGLQYLLRTRSGEALVARVDGLLGLGTKAEEG